MIIIFHRSEACASDRHHLANVGDCRALLIQQNETVCLTRDHNCGNSEEVAKVIARTKDPNPVRPGRDGFRCVHVYARLWYRL